MQVATWYNSVQDQVTQPSNYKPCHLWTALTSQWWDKPALLKMNIQCLAVLKQPVTGEFTSIYLVQTKQGVPHLQSTQHQQFYENKAKCWISYLLCSPRLTPGGRNPLKKVFFLVLCRARPALSSGLLGSWSTYPFWSGHVPLCKNIRTLGNCEAWSGAQQTLTGTLPKHR